MRSKSSSMAVAFALFGLWPASAVAEHRYPLSGNARFQLGAGLPNPVIFTPVPKGRVKAISGARVTQTAGPDPKQLTIPAGQLTAPGNPVNLGVFFANSIVFQVKTALQVSFPKQQATLKANGRTGAATVSFCAGQAVPPGGNPACVFASSGSPINGRLRYRKTANQFGGPAQAALSGSSNAALRASGTPPCGTAACIANFGRTTLPATGPWGAPFGVANNVAHAALSPGLFRVSVNIIGSIFNITATGVAPGFPGFPSSKIMYGGPWTTGKVTVSVTGVLGGGTQIFTLSGSDNRVNGVGSISLVSGAIINSLLSGPSAGRAWLNLTIGEPLPDPGAPGVPALTGWGVGALALLLTWVGMRRARKAERPR